MPETSPADRVAEAFEAQRDRLSAVAYRMLGSHADAEDVVQEAWLRLSRQDSGAIDNLPGWLTTVVGRISVDVLRSRRTRQEASYEARPAELVVVVDEAPGPDEDAVMADSVGIALVMVLESLRPSERLAFVLHDLFGVPFEEIGQILGRSTDATKMLASRARHKVQATQRSTVDRQQARRVVRAFMAAARDGDFEALLRVLDPDVRMTVDGPHGHGVVLGVTEIAAGARLGARAAARSRTAWVGGRPGLVAWREDGSVLSVLAFTVVNGRVTAIDAVTDAVALAGLTILRAD